jgi:putative addiction module component (TIGR02574 family)
MTATPASSSDLNELSVDGKTTELRGNGEISQDVVFSDGGSLIRIIRETMSSAPEDIEAAVLALPRDERAKLAERIVESLADDPSIGDSWLEEARRRLEKFRDGAVDSVSAENVLDEAWKRVGS